MKPERLDHVVFLVRDLDQAATTLKDVLGLDLDQRIGPEGFPAVLGIVPIQGSAPTGAFIELASPVADAQGGLAQTLEERGEGMLSISIEVSDIDTAVSDLRSKGFEVSDIVEGPLPSRTRPGEGRRIARIPPGAAHGVALQLIETGS